MQKYLKFLNIRLDVVAKDVCGLTGLTIIEDICKGNLDPDKLAEHRHYNCKKTKEKITKALNKISRGKLLSNRTPKGSNRMKIALRQAANAIGNLKDTHLSDFFKRVAYRKGRQAPLSVNQAGHVLGGSPISLRSSGQAPTINVYQDSIPEKRYSPCVSGSRG